MVICNEDTCPTIDDVDGSTILEMLARGFERVGYMLEWRSMKKSMSIALFRVPSYCCRRHPGERQYI